MVKSVQKAMRQGDVLPPESQRGRQNYFREGVDLEKIRNHILSYNPSCPHYRREIAPN